MKQFSFLASAIFLLLIGCTDQSATNPQKLKPFEVTIDWVPSPEYYGFFVAKEQGFYKEAGLNVEIKHGSGAPVVANQIASGAIYAGTTTSDNLLRQLARGGKFYEQKAEPLLCFNPSVVVSLKNKPISSFSNLDGRILGVNKQSSVYQQLQYLVEKGEVKSKFTEFPIGWGGVAQINAGQVDAFLAYATNAAVDLSLEKEKDGGIEEIYFSKAGVHLYGLVLAFSDKLPKAITKEDLDAFVKATKKGYEEGAKDTNKAFKALNKVAPTLKEDKVKKAVEKISALNKDKDKIANFDELDSWVSGDGITPEVKNKAKGLYSNPCKNQ